MVIVGPVNSSGINQFHKYMMIALNIKVPAITIKTNFVIR